MDDTTTQEQITEAKKRMFDAFGVVANKIQNLRMILQDDQPISDQQIAEFSASSAKLTEKLQSLTDDVSAQLENANSPLSEGEEFLIANLKAKIKAHDLTFQMSDDSRYYHSGAASMKAIRDLRRNLLDFDRRHEDLFEKIWNDQVRIKLTPAAFDQFRWKG